MPLGQSRTSYQRDHALIAPDSHVHGPHPCWPGCVVITLAAPAMGAKFAEYWVEIPPSATSQFSASDKTHLQRFVLVLSGSIQLALNSTAQHETLTTNDYVFLPADASAVIHADSKSTLVVIEKPYARLAMNPSPPEVVRGNIAQAARSPVGGDPAVQVQKLLPDDSAFDFAVNIMNFEPGGALGQVECHVMEHGLLMLQGEGVYRLGDCWYPVQADDFIYMTPYCPQWFAAHGKQRARYLLYKDWNRDAWT